MKRFLAAALSAALIALSPGTPAFEALAADVVETQAIAVRPTPPAPRVQIGAIPQLSFNTQSGALDLSLKTGSLPGTAATLSASRTDAAAIGTAPAANGAASAARTDSAGQPSALAAAQDDLPRAGPTEVGAARAGTRARVEAPSTRDASSSLLSRARDGWSALIGRERAVEDVPAGAVAGKTSFGRRLSRAKVPLLTAAATLAVPAAAFAADPSMAHHAMASAQSFWDVHQGLGGVGLLAMLAVFPRLTLAAMAALTNSFEVTFLGVAGWVFLPRFVVAALASTVYWGTNPVLVLAAWAIALLDLVPSKKKKDKEKSSFSDTRISAARRIKARARLADAPRPVANETNKVPKRVALAGILGALMFLPIYLHAQGVNPLPGDPLHHVVTATLWTSAITAVKIALTYVSVFLNPAVMSGEDHEIGSYGEAFFLSAMAGTIEELLFRGGLYGALFWAATSLLGLTAAPAFALAAFTSAYIFARIHGYGSIWSRVVGGLFYAGLYFLTGNLIWPILVHFLFDFVLMSLAVASQRSGR